MRQAGLLTLLVAAIALAAADRADALPGPYSVDLRVVGGEDAWNAGQHFQLELRRPPLAGRDFPLRAVGYRVRDAAGAVVVPETRVVGDKAFDGDEVLIQVQVPPLPGVYTAEAWLEGPSGERGPAVSAALRYDHARPGTPRPLAPEGWIAGDALAAISVQPPTGPAPLSGIRGYAIAIDRGGETWPCAARDRCEESEIDLREGAAGGVFRLGTLPEGLSVVRVLAVSGAGVPSSEAAVASIRVDATRPEVTLAGAPASWAGGPVRLIATATDALSGMAPAGPNGPFTAIAVDGGTPRTMLGSSVAATVSGEGIHRVDFYARDLAGNVDSGSPDTATVAIDESPPRLAFADRQDPAEPERLEATVADSLSGVDPDRGSIAVREAGASQAWQPLPTTWTGGRLVARWSSDSYPEGIYEFEATATDVAGNVASSGRRANQTRMVLANPLKAPVRLWAGLAKGGRSTMKVPYGRGLVYRGKLTTAAGSPLGGQPVQVVERFGPGAAVSSRSSNAVTAVDGTFSVPLPPGPSRHVEAGFAGTRTLGSAGGEPAQLEVRAAVAMRASAPTARIGGAPVVFSGRVGSRGARLPGGGLPVELQFKTPGTEWAEFRTVQTDRRGRFRYAYAFSDDDSRGVRFRFRAYMNRGDWPYEPAASNAVSVAGR